LFKNTLPLRPLASPTSGLTLAWALERSTLPSAQRLRNPTNAPLCREPPMIFEYRSQRYRGPFDPGVGAGLSLRARAARTIFWIALERIALQAPSFVTTLLATRLLVTGAYRVMALAGIWTTPRGEGRANQAWKGIYSVLRSAPAQHRYPSSITITQAAIGPAVLFLALIPLTGCRAASDSLLRKRLALDCASWTSLVGW
jgi:hypothetical protein